MESPSTQMEKPKSDLFTSVLLVNNIHCPTCVSYAESTLRPLSDIVEVAISIVSHEIRLEHHRVQTAHAAIQELGNAAFEIQHVKTTDSDGKVIRDHGTNGAGSPRTALYTWPLFMTRLQRKHIENCIACQAKLARQSTKAKIWAAIRRKHQLLDVEEQDSAVTFVDGAASVKASDPHGVDVERASGQGPAEHVASLSIGGMTCQSCTTSITAQVQSLDFARDVNIDLLTNSGTITYQGPKGNSRWIIQSIEDIGYEVVLDRIESRSAGDRSVPLSHSFVATLSIRGMTCGSCVGTLTEGLQLLPFVRGVSIDLVGNSGRIQFEKKENIDRIRERIDELGYDATVLQIQSQDTGQGGDKTASERTITIAIEGMYCEHCPKSIISALNTRFKNSISFEEPLTLQDKKLRVRYKPDPPDLTVREIMKAISSTSEAFSAKIWHPPSIEERSRAMQHQEQTRIIARLVFTILVAIPTLIVGVIYMSLVPSSDSTKKWLEEPVWVGNVSRTEWALFIMTTPIMFFGADIFHTRAFKELKALWRPGSRVPIPRRFYRFGSMNLLISAGTAVAYFSSVAVLVLNARTGAQHAMGSQSGTYFDSVTFLSLFILIGKSLEAYSKAKAGDAVAMLSSLRPDQALLVVPVSKGGFDLEESKVPQYVQVDMLEVGDTVVVPHGAAPPTDGTVTSAGLFLFDESSLTGESKPVKKVAGDQVFAGSVNVSQPVHLRVTSTGGTSMLDRIVAVVREGQTKRAPVERIADTITAYFVPVIVLLAVVTFIVWLVLGQSGALPSSYLHNTQGGWAFWSLEFAIAVFVVACPCGLGLAAPTALFVGGGLAAKHGILVRGGGEAFQEASRLDVIVFDKTGTLTEGQMEVTDFECLPGEKVDEEQRALIFPLAKAMEESSTHPIAKAIASYCAGKDLEGTHIASSDIVEIPGQGMRGKFTVRQGVHQREIVYEAAIGSPKLVSSLQKDHGKEEDGNMYLETTLARFQMLGQSTAILYLRRLHPDMQSPPPSSFTPFAVFAVSDPIRPSAHRVLSTLRDRHKLQVHMCTGDNSTTALAIASQLDIPASNVRAGVMPTDKAAYIRELQQRPSALHGGPTCATGTSTEGRASQQRNQKQRIIAFVGDGTNDTPALSAADVSIALSSGSDIAVSTSSFILLNHDLDTMLTLVGLAKRVFARVRWNFVWAAVYNVVLIPVAAGVFFRLGDVEGTTTGGWRLGPVWASAAMALSSVSVVLSSLALRLPPISVPSWAGRTMWGTKKGQME